MEPNDALEFLTRIGVCGGLELLHRDPHAFLDDLVLAYQEHIPFQTVSLVAQEEDERHVPSLEEVVSAGLTLEGGVCLTLNTFFCLLLQALGLKAHLLDCNYSAWGDDHSHVIVLLTDLSGPGDSYIIDVGCGFPTAAAVPVARLPVTTRHAGLEYRYQHLDDLVVRLHRNGDELLDGENPVMREDWRQVFHFTLAPVDFEYFTPSMTPVFKGSESCDFTHCIRAVRFPPASVLMAKGYLVPAEQPEKDKKEKKNKHTEDKVLEEESSTSRVMLAFKDQTLLMGPMDSAIKTKVEGDVLATKIMDLFPTIPRHKVLAAVTKVLTKEKQTSL